MTGDIEICDDEKAKEPPKSSEELREYRKYYIELLQNEFKSTEFKSCYYLSYEYPEEIYNILKDIQGKSWEDIFSQLKKIKVEFIKDTFKDGKPHRYGGDYKYEEKSIIINITYFSVEADKKVTSKVVGEFKRVFMHVIILYLSDIIKDKKIIEKILRGSK